MEKQDGRIAAVLAEFITKTKYEDLPKETIEKAKHFFLDVIGCIIGASREPQSIALLDVLKAEGGNMHSSVFAHGIKTSVMNSALLNGTMGHIYDFDDDHREGTMHPTVAVFPAVFALGEKMQVSGKNLLRAYIIGMEVMIRVGESFLGQSYSQGFHPTGTCGVFGAAAGCSVIFGLDLQRTIYALGIAGSFSAGLTEWKSEGSWQKPLQAGHPAMSGVLAASLAEKGFIGPGTIFEGPSGAIRAFSFKDQYDYGRITQDLRQKWEMVDNSIKVHACCRFSAPLVDCALELYKKGVRAKDVKEIVAKVSERTIKSLCYPTDRKRRPLTHVDAQFSLPYAIGVGIVKNRAGVEQFKKETFTDPEILALAEKVSWELDPRANELYPKAYPATVVATLKDGRVLEGHVDYPKGDPENPATMDEIVNKFNGLTEKYFDKKRREKIIEEIGSVEKVGNLVQIADLLR